MQGPRVDTYAGSRRADDAIPLRRRGSSTEIHTFIGRSILVQLNARGLGLLRGNMYGSQRQSKIRCRSDAQILCVDRILVVDGYAPSSRDRFCARYPVKPRRFLSLTPEAPLIAYLNASVLSMFSLRTRCARASEAFIRRADVHRHFRFRSDTCASDTQTYTYLCTPCEIIRPHSFPPFLGNVHVFWSELTFRLVRSFHPRLSAHSRRTPLRCRVCTE